EPKPDDDAHPARLMETYGAHVSVDDFLCIADPDEHDLFTWCHTAISTWNDLHGLADADLISLVSKVRDGKDPQKEPKFYT
ncbi:MAG: hypothetical protein GYA24_19440, partial [Candidatus Lokiarchaeota archaeon]|nr:hypothetical protein [Candidatus Lokiarchaeota archaeon]